jgi:hypothetical protein
MFKRPMNPELERAWQTAAENPGTEIDIGRIVVCDACSADYTDSKEVGGLIFGSKAICPRCASRAEVEPSRIRARCAPDVPFADFVRGYRGDNNAIQIIGPMDG